jgi:transmembrane sensor
MHFENEHIDSKIDLITKKLSGNLSESETVQFNNWIELNDENKIEFETFRKTWETINTPKLAEDKISVNVDAAWENVFTQINTKKENVIPINRFNSSTSTKWMAAASVVILIASSIFYFSPDKVIQYATLNDDIDFNLTDGSTINLNAQSKLTLAKDFNENERHVKLEGEGYFDISKNKEKPFYVHTSLVDIKVVGTSFNVKENDDSVIVLVESGIVEVLEANHIENKTRLTKGDQIVYSRDGNSFIQLTKDTNRLAWKTKKIVFKHIPLKEVAKTLTSVYHKEVKFKNLELEDCMLSASFDEQTLNQIVAIISATFQLTVTENNGTIILDGKSCE